MTFDLERINTATLGQSRKARVHSRALQLGRQYRNLSNRCANCGSEVVRWGGSSAPPHKWVGRIGGRVELGRCRACVEEYRRNIETNLVLRKEGETVPTPVTLDEAVLWRRLEAEGLDAYLPESYRPGLLQALCWASWALRARLSRQPEPGDPAQPFSHLTEVVPDPSVIDWTPPDPQTPEEVGRIEAEAEAILQEF